MAQCYQESISKLNHLNLNCIRKYFVFINTEKYIHTKSLYGFTTWNEMLGEKARWELLKDANKSWTQDPTKLYLYDHIPAFSQTVLVRQTRHAGHFFRSKDKCISNILL